jgi:hypothetical protein
MNRAFRRTGTAALVLTFSAVTFAADGQIAIVPVHRVGDESNWIQSSNLLSNILPVGVQTKLHEQITEVAADGSYTVAVTQGKSRVSWAFEELTSPDDEIKSSYRCNSRGELIALDADPIYAEWAARSHDLQTVITPDHPVSVGDTWSYDFAANSATGAVAAHGSYKLVSVNPGQSVTVQIDVREVEGIAPASCTGEVVLNFATFTPASLSLKLKDAAVPGLPGLGSGTVSMKPDLR